MKKSATLLIKIILLLSSVYACDMAGNRHGEEGSGNTAPEKGALSRDFTLKNLSGKDVSLSDFRGNIVFLNFWATWCPPCRQEMPSMEKLHEKYKDRGLTILAVAGDGEGVELVRPFVEERNFTFPVLIDDRGKAADIYRIFAVPTTIIIGTDGKIIGKVQGAADWFSEEVQDYFDGLLEKVDKA